MKTAVLYSGGKDSSLMATILRKLGFEVELCTVNFGIYNSYFPARKSAEALGFAHRVVEMDEDILKKACEMILSDGFPNEGIRFLHKASLEYISNDYDVIADGIRRDDRTPKLDINQIRSLEDRFNVQYINLDSFGHKSIKYITESLFNLTLEKSNKDNSSDYEVEIRLWIDENGGDSQSLFPEHYQTRVIGYK